MTPGLHNSYKMSFGIYCDILQAGHRSYTQAWNRYLTRSTPMGDGQTDFILWMNQQLPLFNKNPFVPIPMYICRLCGSLSWQQPSAACLPTWVWLCAFWLVLGSPRVCTAALQWQFDGVLLPILPSLNRSCCHLYFDLCIPWSIYACERWEGRRGEEGAGGRKEDGNNSDTCCYTRGNACGTFAF